jgi:hypothetical protein
MAEPDPMTLSERGKYLGLIEPRYLQARHRERGTMLDEAERVAHQHRKSLIRLRRGSLERKPRRRQPGPHL